MSPSSIAQPALYLEVAERLRQRIFSHELQPGAWVDEQALAEQYGISRTPLREALSRAAAATSPNWPSATSTTSSR